MVPHLSPSALAKQQQQVFSQHMIPMGLIRVKPFGVKYSETARGAANA